MKLGNPAQAKAMADAAAARDEALRPALLPMVGQSSRAIAKALTDQGVEFTKVAMQPGMPQGAGRFRGVPVVTVPGNPVSALVSFEVFLRPAPIGDVGENAVEDPGTIGARRRGDAIAQPADGAVGMTNAILRVTGLSGAKEADSIVHQRLGEVLDNIAAGH